MRHFHRTPFHLFHDSISTYAWMLFCYYYCTYARSVLVIIVCTMNSLFLSFSFAIIALPSARNPTPWHSLFSTLPCTLRAAYVQENGVIHLRTFRRVPQRSLHGSHRCQIIIFFDLSGAPGYNVVHVTTVWGMSPRFGDFVFFRFYLFTMITCHW